MVVGQVCREMEMRNTRRNVGKATVASLDGAGQAATGMEAIAQEATVAGGERIGMLFVQTTVSGYITPIPDLGTPESDANPVAGMHQFARRSISGMTD